MPKWKILNGPSVSNIQQWVRDNSQQGQAVEVGCDSLQVGLYTDFVVVVVILTPGKGGRVAYCREKISRIKDLRQRLLAEVQRSINVGLELAQVAPKLTIHIDANSQEQHMSSRWVEELAGYCVGMGFRAVIKPDAFVATTTADHVLRAGSEKLRVIK